MAHWLTFLLILTGTTLVQSRARGQEDLACQLTFRKIIEGPKQEHREAESSSGTKALTLPRARGQVMRALELVLPMRADLEYFEFCGEGCLQGSRELERRFPKAPNLKILITEESTTELLYDPTNRILRLHPTDASERERLKDYLTQWLVSHPLHPFSESSAYGPKPFRFKLSQMQALEAIETAQRLGQNKLLIVGTGGVGKTPIMLSHIEKSLWKSNQTQRFNFQAALPSSGKKRFHLVVVNSTAHLNQFVRTLETLVTEPHRMIAWGDEFGSTPFPIFFKEIARVDRPVILVSTIASFRNRFYEDPTLNTDELSERLESLSFDEVHHAGAKLMRPILSSLTMGAPKFFTIGTTATPVHREVSIQEMFGHRSFWLNLHSELPPQHELSLRDIVAQYENTVNKGEITPLERLYLLNPESLGFSKSDLFVNPSGLRSGRRVLSPEAYSKVFGLLAPLYRESGPSITIAGSIASAEWMFQYLRQHFPEKQFGILHSKSPNAKTVYEDFETQRIDHLVAVEMVDEAYNFPHLQTLIDLTSSASARQIIQRFARPSRLADGKREVTVALFVGASERHLEEQIEILDRLTTHRNQSQHLRRRSLQAQILLSSQAPEFQDWAKLRKNLVAFRDQRRAVKARRIAQIENHIRLRKNDKNPLPKTRDPDPEIRLYAQWFAEFKTDNKATWYLSFAPDVLQILSEKNLIVIRHSRKERLKQVTDHIRQNLKSASIFPSKYDPNPATASLGAWWTNFKSDHPDSWHLFLPEDIVFDTLAPRALLPTRSRKTDDILNVLRTEGRLPAGAAKPDVIPLLSEYFLEHQHEEKPTPSASSDDPYTRWLGVTFNNLKTRNPNWQSLFKPNVIQILENSGSLERYFSEAERIQQLEVYIREHAKDRKPLPPTRHENHKIKSLGKWFDNFKRKKPETWHTTLADDAQVILRTRQVIP